MPEVFLTVSNHDNPSREQNIFLPPEPFLPKFSRVYVDRDHGWPRSRGHSLSFNVNIYKENDKYES